MNRPTLSRWQYSPNSSIDSVQSPIRIPADISAEINKLILKYTGNSKGARLAKRILKENKLGLILSNIKTYYKAIVVNTQVQAQG